MRKFSELTYLIVNSFEETDLIDFFDPIAKTKEELCIEEALEFLIENFQIQIDAENEEESKKIIHWWNRNWTVSLDLYLSSTDEEKGKFSLCTQRISKPISFPFHTLILEKCAKENTIDFLTALLNRKTYRKFIPNQLPIKTFSSLIGSISKIKESIFSQSLDYYIGIFNVEKVPQGIYRYSQEGHLLEGLLEGDFREKFRSILCGMATALSASFVIVMVADYEFLQNNLSFNRALRDLYVEIGRIGQHLLVQGAQNNLGGLPSPAMKDSEMVSLLKLNIAHEIPMYSLIMGMIPTDASLDPIPSLNV